MGQDISPKELKQLGATGADYNYWAYHKNPDWLKDLKNSGMTSNVWTVNIPSEMQWCIDNGFDLMKSINIIAIMPFLASSFMTQAPVYQDVNHPIGDRVVGVWKTNSKQESHVS